MSYNYQTQRPFIFTEDGMQMLLKIRDTTNVQLKTAGAVRADKMMAQVYGSSWDMLACIDYLVERGEIREVTDGRVAGQYRIFTSHNV